MTVFWILAAALVVAVLLALLRPLLRPAAAAADEAAASNLRILREQLAELDAELAAGSLAPEQHAGARAELERRVLEETRAAEAAPAAAGGRRSALVLAVAVPALAVLLYAQLGNRAGLDAVIAQPPSQASPQDVEALVQRLAERMQAKPDDPLGWALLARAYAGMQQFDRARDAFAEAVRRNPPDAQLLADYADAMAMAQDRSLQGEPEKLVLQALKIDPDHLKALALAGSAAMQRQDPSGALVHWLRARRVAEPGSPFAQGLEASIADAVAAGGRPPAGALAAAPGPRPAAPATQPMQGGPQAAPLRVAVRVAPALAARLQPGDTLFVFARAAEGPRMPLAIVRQPAAAGPLNVVLDDSTAMAPELRLSQFAQVVVGARITRSGNATPQPGDLEGQSAPTASAGRVEVLIDRVRE